MNAFGKCWHLFPWGPMSSGRPSVCPTCCSFCLVLTRLASHPAHSESRASKRRRAQGRETSQEPLPQTQACGERSPHLLRDRPTPFAVSFSFPRTPPLSLCLSTPWASVTCVSWPKALHKQVLNESLLDTWPGPSEGLFTPGGHLERNSNLD